MDALIAALLTWVPAVIVRTLVVRAPEDHPAAPDAASVAGRDERINALYAATVQPRLTICAIAADLVEGSDAFDNARDNPLCREILLHELVHHTQWQAGEAVCSACAAEGEGEAYALGGRYVAATRTDDPLMNRNPWARIYSPS